MNSARTLHTATILTNEKVLVAGGKNFSNFLNSAEVYDSSTGVWTITDNMNNARNEHTASILTNGEVLVTGGQDNSLYYLNSSGLYQP